MAGRAKRHDARRGRLGYAARFRGLLALWRPALHAALGAGLIAQSVGCTRPFYRKRADNEVAEILAQKDKYPAWKIENWHVYPDPRARFGDPTNPDRPPMPPDDDSAYKLSPHPQNPGHAGVGRIEGTGYLEMIKTWDSANREEREA